MKGYKNFLIVFTVVLTFYVLTEVNRPKPINWTVTLGKNDKIPYGGYIIFNQLHYLFPGVTIQSFRAPLYAQINNFEEGNTAYIILTPNFGAYPTDMVEMKNYVSKGNYVFASADVFDQTFLDSLNLKADAHYSISSKDSTSTNFVNPALKAPVNYTFFHTTIDQYFSKIDTPKTTILGQNNHHEPDFIKVVYGEGAFFIHANPICFSNYFLLRGNNASYAAKALSYLPADVTSIYWDEYYKSGREGAQTPFRFLLSNEYLRWALRLALIGLILYVLFQAKRKQRIIPVIEPLQNTTLDFVKTVSGVYFNAKDNNSIAAKKITYFLDFVRQRFGISTQQLDEHFTTQLSRKSNIKKEELMELVSLVASVENEAVSDSRLLLLNNKIDHFYKQV